MTEIATQDFTASQLKLIRNTIAKDTTPDEFNLFIQQCRLYGLNPIKKEIYILVFNKDKPKYRSTAIITGIDGYRVIAERTGNYRADEDAPRYEYDEKLKGDTNPLGIVSATVSVWKYSHGEWFRTTAIAYWDEYAPVKDEWANGKKTGNKYLTGEWPVRPLGQIAKCGEALALRKAFPNDLGNIYTQDEIDRAQTIDGTAIEVLQAHEHDERRRKAGLMNAIPFQPLTGSFDMVPIGQFADRVIEFLDQCQTAEEVISWRDINSGEGRGLRSFWAENPSDALELKAKIEQRERELKVAKNEN